MLGIHYVKAGQKYMYLEMNQVRPGIDIWPSEPFVKIGRPSGYLPLHSKVAVEAITGGPSLLVI